MENNKEMIKSKGSGLVKLMYIISAVLAVIFVYMLIVNIMYISSYAASYGMKFSDMWQEAVQYIVTGSVSYFVYAVLVFSAGKVIGMLTTDEIPDHSGEAKTDDIGDVSTEDFDPDQVIKRLNKKETVEEQPDAKEDVTAEMYAEPVKQRRKRRYMK